MSLVHVAFTNESGTYSRFRPHVCSPDATKGNEEQLFTGVIQTREEIVILLLVELGLPSPECLNDAAIPDILRRGPISRNVSKTRSSGNGVKEHLQFAL